VKVGLRPFTSPSLLSKGDTPMAKRILIIDDDRILRGMIASGIQQIHGADVDVCEASSGEEALELIDTAHSKGEPFRVVITDGQMFGMNGIELITQLRANPNHNSTDIVMLTAADPKFCEAAHGAGASLVIRKPGLIKLLDFLAKALES
jgi:CheY-like chemotaxis protein